MSYFFMISLGFQIKDQECYTLYWMMVFSTTITEILWTLMMSLLLAVDLRV